MLFTQGKNPQPLIEKFNRMDGETRNLLQQTVHTDKWKFYGATLTQLLLRYQPRVLELREEWVDKLLDFEKDIKGYQRISCFTCLL